ncbi:MAG: phosphate ABC transporter permease subunit PstC [Nocardioides sp.]
MFRPEHLHHRGRPGETLIVGLLRLAAMLSVLVTVGILFALVVPAVEFFREISPSEFLTGTRWAPTFADQSFGVVPLVLGTLWTTVIGLCVAVPFGLGAAVFLSEYASTRMRKILKPVLELLAGIPSVVYGFFALQFVTPWFFREFLGMEIQPYNVLAAGVVLGVMIIPTVASLSEDALSAVPQALRDGSLSLGANRMQTTLRVVFPAALSGIAAAVVLGISRAVGETMIVALAAGTQARMITDPTQGAQTMTGFIAQAATGENPVGSLEYNTLFAVGLLLFVITLFINMISIFLVRRIREAY